ncbi:MAG: excinuclease ABC subunit UvrB [Bacteroidota bacterium]
MATIARLDSPFRLDTPFQPMGDQPRAIGELTEGIFRGDPYQTLLGATGTGKTFTLANVIQNTGKPTLVLSHNKTLAAQLYAEFNAFFPHNAVEFFISYYDYYQPEAYIVSSDTYIEKDMAINEEIDRLRLRATSSLVSGRDDIVIVASVSCIYGLGNPEEYKAQIVQVTPGDVVDRDDLLRQLVSVFYTRNDVDFSPGAFRVRGDVVEIFPAYLEDQAYRIAFWGDEVEKIARINPVTGDELAYEQDVLTIYPAKQFVTPKDQVDRAIQSIEEELRWRLAVLRNEGNMVAAQRLEQRTLFDIEMIKEIGYCSGIENYSRHMDGREPGSRPYCLLDYFDLAYGDEWMLAVDESHVSIPQVRGMYNGDRARKLNLVEHGFRLPSAMDNRPLTFEEFEDFHKTVLFVSATPADYELETSGGVVVEQIIRPTGILDPEVQVRPVEGQIDDLLDEIRQSTRAGGRVLVTTLTKRMSEDLTDYLDSFGVRVRYLHSDIDALARVDILRDLRLGAFDVLVGINLLREGLDLPEVNLVAILDADKEGFLRSERSLIQTAGRAARNADSKVILYADNVTDSMQRMMDETERRRQIQQAYNEEHGITPQTVQKSTDEVRRGTAIADHKAEQDERRAKQATTYYAGPEQLPKVADPVVKYLTDDQKRDLVAQLTREMDAAAENLEFEKAAELRDSIAQIEAELAA